MEKAIIDGLWRQEQVLEDMKEVLNLMKIPARIEYLGEDEAEGFEFPELGLRLAPTTMERKTIARTITVPAWEIYVGKMVCATRWEPEDYCEDLLDGETYPNVYSAFTRMIGYEMGRQAADHLAAVIGPREWE